MPRLRMGVVLCTVTVCVAVCWAVEAAPRVGDMALCVGVNRQPLLGDVKGCRESAQALGAKLTAGGYQSVVVLTDDAKRWEGRASVANIRSHILQMTQLAGPQDMVLVFFAGRGLVVAGKPCIAPINADDDNALPLAWVMDTLASSKAGGKILVVQTGEAAKPLADGLTGRRYDRGIRIVLPRTIDDIPRDMIETSFAAEPLKPGYGRIRFTIHRDLYMHVIGTSYEVWKINDRSYTLSYKFKEDSHALMGTVDLPAGEYTMTMQQWRHHTNYGIFIGGPYKALPRKFRVDAGRIHQMVQFNRQTSGPHGVGIVFFDGRRIRWANNLTRQVLGDVEIEKAQLIKTPALQIKSSLVVANSQRVARLYAMALKGYKKAMRQARKLGNRIVIAQAARDKAFLFATARKASFRDAKRALVLAEEAIMLADETRADNRYTYKNALAAALAEAGNFDEAAKVMSEAIALTKNNKPYPVLPHIMNKLKKRLEGYRAKQPCRE